MDNTPGNQEKRKPWIPALIGVGVLAVALVAVYDLANTGGLDDALGPLAAPYKELVEQYQGQTGDLGEREYIVVAATAITPESRDAFLKRHPEIQYRQPGAVGDTLVVTIPPPAKEKAEKLRKDPFVSFVLTNRLGMFCH